MPLIEHLASGDNGTCARCGAPASKHRKPRIWHRSAGNPCAHCGEPAAAHPSPTRLKARAKYDAGRDDRKAERRVIGVDGEGRDLPDGRHIYTYLCAVDERGKVVAQVRNPRGLSHQQCVKALLGIPRNSLKFGFGLTYDVTKIIESLALEDIYYVVRPDARRRFVCKTCGDKWTLRSHKRCPSCGSSSVRPFVTSWRIGSLRYDYMRGSFTVARAARRRDADTDTGAERERVCKLWDAQPFFRASFVQALMDLDIGTPEERERIAAMKALRGDFAHVPEAQIEAYCRDECRLLATMMGRLIEAHGRVGLRLTRYDGAGSTAAALLDKYGVRAYIGPRLDRLPAALRAAISLAHFGGRFEQSIVGRIERPVHSFDIRGAYPAALHGLPCLKCGRWEHVRGRGVLKAVERGDLACVRFEMRTASARERRGMPWAPLPCRDKTGSLVFGTGFSGWAWKPEALAALRGWPDLVKLTEAWIYRTPCRHRHKPFAFMQDVWDERVRLGEDAAGKVLKVAMNACGGKLSQRMGSDRYRSPIWAGNMMAHTRAQILDVLAEHGGDVLSIATDGICATRDLGLASEGLGGWKHEVAPEGAFFCSPGLYFRLDLSQVKSRGHDRTAWASAAPAVLAVWERWDRRDFERGASVEIKERRFYGAKHSIVAASFCQCGGSWPGTPEMGCPKCGRVGQLMRAGVLPGIRYGTWADHVIRESFDPWPKRERKLRSDGDWSPLRLRDLGGRESLPYTPGRKTPEAEGRTGLHEDLPVE